MRDTELREKYPEFSKTQFFSAFNFYKFNGIIPTYVIRECNYQHEQMSKDSDIELVRSNGRPEVHVRDDKGYFTNPLLNPHMTAQTSSNYKYVYSINYLLGEKGIAEAVSSVAHDISNLSRLVVFEVQNEISLPQSDGLVMFIPLERNDAYCIQTELGEVRVHMEIGDVLLVRGYANSKLSPVKSYCPCLRALIQ
jgi:hypothetical protein